MLFYILVYALANVTVFGAIAGVENSTGGMTISDYKGMAKSNPLIALAMLLGLFSLAGIPPLAGFTGKFFLFGIAAKSGYYWLVGLGAVNSTVSLYYYLRIVGEMYISDISDADSTRGSCVKFSPLLSFTVVASAMASLYFGVFPGLFESIRLQTVGWLVNGTGL